MPTDSPHGATHHDLSAWPAPDPVTAPGGEPPSPGPERTERTPFHGRVEGPALVGVSFDRPVRAKEFMLALARLREDGALDLKDAVVVTKREDGSTHVTETLDPTPGRAALSGAVWTGLLGLVVGGPIGWLAGLGVGAGAGAITAKVVDIGVPDEWVEWYEQAARPGTATVIALTEGLDVGALAAEARRFAGAELLYSTLPAASIDALAAAFDAG